jgi:hypothetical protein
MKRDSDETARTLMDAQREKHEVSVIDLRCEKDYLAIMDVIRQSDAVISW